MLRVIRCSTLALLVALPAVAAGQNFEGRVTVETGGAGRPPVPMIILSKGGKSRIEATAGGMPMAMIMDYAAGSIVTLMPAQKMYMRLDMRQMEQQMRGMTGAPDADESPKYTRTGRRETIAGVSCEHILFESKDGKKMDICAAQGMGFFGGAGGSAQGGRGAGVPAAYDKLIREFRDGFFPLKMEMVEGTTRTQVFLVTKVERQAVDAALFSPPTDYSEMKMPTMPGRP